MLNNQSNLLNHPDKEIRLKSLQDIIKSSPKPEKGIDVNNHIHTFYSFSPYSPSNAVWQAYKAGLSSAGIMDHDTLAGAREFIEAGKITGLPTTIGLECRADFSKTSLAGRRINNPDQINNAYVAIHGVPHGAIDTVMDFFYPLIARRYIRNQKMMENINRLLKPHEIAIDFEKDVVPISMLQHGGVITERHLLFALSKELIEKIGKGEPLVSFLSNKLGVKVPAKAREFLADESNDLYDFDLLNVLKASMVSSFYIDATDECADIRDIIELSNEIGAIFAYAYLGDVGDSVTGDKKAQKFEDDYIGLLFEELKSLGINAVTYMPSRNTASQLKRIQELCSNYGFFQISGEDINSPRQKFICEAIRKKEFSHLIDSTWALIGHEKAATEDPAKGMFSKASIKTRLDLKKRISEFARLGREPINSTSEF
jgi:hypothetical protein